MGLESANYFLALPADAADAVVHTLSGDRAGAELTRSSDARLDYRVRDPHRYWIDVHVHRLPEPCLEIRIALTNDEWSIRAPLQRALTPLPVALVGQALRDDEGRTVAVAGEKGWWLRVEEDFGRRREAFVARVGDYNAPLSTDHVYMYVHQTRWNRDNDDELAWHREREIARIEEMWDKAAGDDEVAPPADAEDIESA